MQRKERFTKMKVLNESRQTKGLHAETPPPAELGGVAEN